MTNDESDYEDIDAAADEMADATEDTSRAERWFARGYVVGLVALIVGGLGALLYFDFIDLQLVVSASVNAGWIIEYFLAAIAFLLVAFTGFMVIKAVGGNLVASAIKAVARVADNYELPQR